MILCCFSSGGLQVKCAFCMEDDYKQNKYRVWIEPAPVLSRNTGLKSRRLPGAGHGFD
jgi:hypothetical protein